MSSANVKYVAESLQKLPHPPPASVSSHCSCLREHTERQKVPGSGLGGRREGGCEWHLGNARWPLQHVSFHASFIHFITSLGRCEGVEKKPCYTETEWEGPHSIFSSPGAAIAPGWIATCMGKKCRGERWEGRGAMWMRRGSWRAVHVAAHEISLGVKGRRLRGGSAGAFFVHALLVTVRGETPLRVLLQGFFFVRSVFSIWVTKCFCAPRLYIDDCVTQRSDFRQHDVAHTPWSFNFGH